MTDVFLFGPLLDHDLRRCVAGGDLHGVPAVLPGHGAWQMAEGEHPVLGNSGDGVAGLLLFDVPADTLARLDFYAQGVGHVPASVAVDLDGAQRPAQAYLPADPAPPATAKPWDLGQWQQRWGALTRTSAQEAMALFGRIDGAGLRAIMGTIRIRADSALRAAADTERPPLQDHGLNRRNVDVLSARRPYVAYFAVDEHDLRHTRFDGTQSDAMTRGAFLMGDAVTVLPYDPVRDRVLLVEQFRFGMFTRGDPRPWSLEPVAGRIDPGETPEQTARRETVEEAGLTLQALRKVAAYYPSPAAVTEFLYSYVGLCDLPDLGRGTGGLDAEHEDIRTHVMPFDALLALADGGGLNNAPLLLTAHWLARHRGGIGAPD